jgi:hypothetical protein
VPYTPSPDGINEEEESGDGKNEFVAGLEKAGAPNGNGAGTLSVFARVPGHDRGLCRVCGDVYPAVASCIKDTSLPRGSEYGDFDLKTLLAMILLALAIAACVSAWAQPPGAPFSSQPPWVLCQAPGNRWDGKLCCDCCFDSLGRNCQFMNTEKAEHEVGSLMETQHHVGGETERRGPCFGQ